MVVYPLGFKEAVASGKNSNINYSNKQLVSGNSPFEKLRSDIYVNNIKLTVLWHFPPLWALARSNEPIRRIIYKDYVPMFQNCLRIHLYVE